MAICRSPNNPCKMIAPVTVATCWSCVCPPTSLNGCGAHGTRANSPCSLRSRDGHPFFLVTKEHAEPNTCNVESCTNASKESEKCKDLRSSHSQSLPERMQILCTQKRGQCSLAACCLLLHLNFKVICSGCSCIETPETGFTAICCEHGAVVSIELTCALQEFVCHFPISRLLSTFRMDSPDATSGWAPFSAKGEHVDFNGRLV